MACRRFATFSLVIVLAPACASRGGGAVPNHGGASSNEANAGEHSVPAKCGGASGGVKIDEVLEHTFEGAEIRAELKRQYLARQGELDREQASLEKERDELEKASKVSSKEALEARLKAFQERLMALQAKMLAFQKQLTELESALIAKGRARVRAFVHARGPELAGSLFAIADEEKTTLWIAPGCEKAWIAPSVNLTDDVTKRYEATHGAIPGETTM
jgi:Skp family chaperone for outer membrane proteins